MHVSFFIRHPMESCHSIERLFSTIQQSLPEGIDSDIVTCPQPSRGIIPRLHNGIYARHYQGDINHITGDVNYLAAFLPQRKTILTIHDCGGLKEHRRQTLSLFRFFWYTMPAARVSLITTVSDFTRCELLRQIPCDPNKVRVIPNCIPPGYIPSSRSFNPDKPVILHVGSMRNKNLIREVQALRGIPCHLRIIGLLGADQLQALQAAGIDYSVKSNISNAQMIEEYRICDFLLFASTYEGFGMPILEAQATGRPVVTSNVASMPEVASNSACLVNPFDVDSIRSGILRVILAKGYREELIQRGYANVARFSPKKIATQYAGLYRELYSKER